MLRRGFGVSRRTFSWLPRAKKVQTAPLLSILADTTLDVGEIHEKVERIEAIHSVHQRTMSRTTKQLDYILNNFGLEGVMEDRHLVGDLLKMPVEGVESMLRGRSLTRSQLLTVVAHLIFRGQLTVDTFMKVVLRLPVADVVGIQGSLVEDPGHVLCEWERDERTRVMAGVVIASRFKIAGDYDHARGMVSEQVLTSWMPAVKRGVLTCGDMHNLVGLLDGMIEHNALVDVLVSGESGDLMYAFWERHTRDTALRETVGGMLEKQSVKRFVVEMMESVVVATNRTYAHRVMQMSRSLHLSSLAEGQIGQVKFVQWVELLLGEMREAVREEALVESLRGLEDSFEEFKGSKGISYEGGHFEANVYKG